MIKRYSFVFIFGIAGALALTSLSVWQFQRLEQKLGIIADIEAQITQKQTIIPKTPSAVQHRYLPVIASGKMGEESLHILTSTPERGPGFRVVTSLETTDRKILLDRGFVPQRDKDSHMYAGAITVTGNLDWPRETDTYTPAPDLTANIWFARDVEAMADALGTEPVLLVAKEKTGNPGPDPMPVTVNIRNNHLEYAITWALMAVVWLAMSAYLVLRIRRNTA